MIDLISGVKSSDILLTCGCWTERGTSIVSWQTTDSCEKTIEVNILFWTTDRDPHLSMTTISFLMSWYLVIRKHITLMTHFVVEKRNMTETFVGSSCSVFSWDTKWGDTTFRHLPFSSCQCDIEENEGCKTRSEGSKKRKTEKHQGFRSLFFVDFRSYLEDVSLQKVLSRKG